jgi:pimeloyl-ACP methyl ester carboxylesterase
LKKALRIAGVFVALAVIVLALAPRETAPRTGAWLARRQLTPETVKTGRFELRYVRKGQGPTVVLLHGLASSIYSWSDVIDPLSAKFDVVAVDLPGFGESSQPADLGFADFEPSIVALMDALAIPKAHFVGNSMGGGISLVMAAHRPDRVDHLVIIDSAGFDMRPSERPFMVRVIGSETAGFIADRAPIRRALTGATLRHLFHDDSRVTEERIDEYVAPLLRPGALVAARSLLASPVDGGLVPDLTAIRARTLVMWGRFDPWLPVSHADRFATAIPGARKVLLETGHMPQEERPGEVARIIGEFLVS